MAHAEDEGRLTARGAGYANVIFEKCYGSQSPAQANAELKSFYKNMQNAGYDFSEIQAGYLQGAMLAESRYTKGSKIPNSECKDAAKIKKALEKIQ